MKNGMLTAMAAIVLLGSILMPDSVLGQIVPGVRVVTLTGYRARFDNGQPVTQRYLLIDVTNGDRDGDGEQDFRPLDPVAILLLLPGGDGRLNLNAGQRETGSPAFPVSTRYHFAAEEFVVAAMDAASDFLVHNHSRRVDLGFPHESGLNGHRLPNRLHGNLHIQDLEAVINDLRAKFPGLPLWTVGISRGTLSAVVAATELASPPDGIVLMTPLTGVPGPSTNSLGNLSPTHVDLSKVIVPTLIVSNQDDQCPGTQTEDAKLLKKRFTSSPRVQLLIFNGGSTPLAQPCDALSAHTFFGIEQKVIEAVTRWIKHSEE